MMRWRSLGVVTLMLAVAACADGKKSPAGLHFPDGDPTAGQQAFLDLRCHSCHWVRDLDLPPPVADPTVPVILGGKVTAELTDGALITAIVDPSHAISPRYRQEQVGLGGLSRMGDYSDAMTVRQLVDLVAFLHDQYEVVPGMGQKPFR